MYTQISSWKEPGKMPATVAFAIKITETSP